MWRFVYGFPLIIHIAIYVFIGVSLKHPSLKELIKCENSRGKEIEARKLIKKIYKFDRLNEEAHIEDIMKSIDCGVSEI